MKLYNVSINGHTFKVFAGKDNYPEAIKKGFQEYHKRFPRVDLASNSHNVYVSCY